MRIRSSVFFLSVGVLFFALVSACFSTSDPDKLSSPEKETVLDASVDAGKTADVLLQEGGSPDVGQTTADASAQDVQAESGTSPPDYNALLQIMQNCTQISDGFYAKDSGGTASVPVCDLSNAVFWRADMDIDCDGISSSACNKTADPSYQSQTAVTDSSGQYLNAAELPYVVIPLSSTVFRYRDHNLYMKAAALVHYNGKWAYGVVGDLGPSSIIGEASYAMAQVLGIDPDPSTGGVSNGVDYIVFKGTEAIVSPVESVSEAKNVGEGLVRKTILEN